MAQTLSQQKKLLKEFFYVYDFGIASPPFHSIDTPHFGVWIEKKTSKIGSVFQEEIEL